MAEKPSLVRLGYRITALQAVRNPNVAEGADGSDSGMAAIPQGSGWFLTMVPGVSRGSTPGYRLASFQDGGWMGWGRAGAMSEPLHIVSYKC